MPNRNRGGKAVKKALENEKRFIRVLMRMYHELASELPLEYQEFTQEQQEQMVALFISGCYF